MSSGFLGGGIGPTAITWRSSGWWEVAGQTCVAAYQPKGAASLAASYINLANPGTYDAAPGTAPSFDTATGWTFAAASSQYLTTGIVFGVNWTILVRVGSATQSFGYLIGAQSTSAALNVGFMPYGSTSRYYVHGTQLAIAGAQTGASIMAIAGANGYLNGALEAGSMTPGAGVNRTLFIAARNTGSASNHFSGIIRAIAIYNSTLTAAQVAALTTKMAAL